MLKISKERREALVDLSMRARAIDAMLQRCIDEQQLVEYGRDKILAEIREEHGIDKQVDFIVDHDSGELTIIEPPAGQGEVNNG